ncbi:MAG: exo-alpha-sialidase, partial [Schleiferiaceae bacterium]|nr:exo-alpha-sialidase [Schleiferiaceae bacterium]
SGTLNVSWTEFDAYGRTEPEFKSRIRFSQSYDRGETWSPAITVSRQEGNCLDGDETPEGAIPVADPTGGVAVVWSYRDTVWMNRSDDDGAMTWMPVDRPIALQQGGWAHEIPALGRANGMPISYFAPNGTWHLIYGEQDSTKSWVSHATSTDRGENWSQPSRLPVPDSIRHHFMPWFAIDASNGALHVLAYGQTASMRTQAWVHRSDDGGTSWSATALSTPFTPTPKRFFGDYSGIAARNGDVHAVWTEQREGVNELVYGRFADPALDETMVNTPTKKRRKK